MTSLKISRWGRAGAGLATIAVSSVLVASLMPAQTSALSAGAVDSSRHPHPSKARNVIFIQGDGMGIAHRELIRLATKGRNGELAMNKMKATGFVHTDPADPDEAVTDSAAAATAYATGVRSYNGAVGVDVKGRQRSHAPGSGPLRARRPVSSPPPR